jgi:hypothetical protein
MRKIINPPNMGTKSDPGIKITIPERKKRKKREPLPLLCRSPSAAGSCEPVRALPPLPLLLLSCPPSSQIPNNKKAELAPPTNNSTKYGIMPRKEI